MATIPSLRNQQLPPTLDAGFLLAEARKKIEQLAGDRWTDYNDHDPGITILEMLAYAITDLGMRTRLDIRDLLAGGGQDNFFTARQALPNAPLTPEDYRKLLIDRPDVRNAWVESALGSEEERHTCLLDLVPDEAHPNLDLHQNWLWGGTIEIEETSYPFYVVFPDWNDLAPAWSSEADLSSVQIGAIGRPEDPERPVQDQYTAEGRFTFGNAETVDTLLWIRLSQGLPKAADGGPGPRDAIFQDMLRERLAGNWSMDFFRVHQQRARIRRRRLDDIRRFLMAHRNLGEDWGEVSTIRVQEIGLRIAGLELTPGADPSEVLARVFLLLEQFIDPPIHTLSLQEMLDRGYRPEDIFAGPALENGFITDEALSASDRGGKIYTSDLVRIIMQQPEVIGVRGLALDHFLERFRRTAGARNCLSLHQPERYKPRLSVRDSQIRVHVRGVEQPVTQAALWERLNKRRAEFAAQRPPEDTPDLPVPLGEPLEVERYYSIQNEFPRAYGLRAGEIRSDAPPQRQGRARQLKAYLLFFEQLLANYCAQLSHLQLMFSGRKDIEQTYFYHPLYRTPAVQSLFKDFDESTGSWETFTESYNEHERALKEFSEDENIFLRRRNSFIDHLLSRFGASFSEYASWALGHEGGAPSPGLLLDKLTFLQKVDSLASHRAQAFDYTSIFDNGSPDIWDSENVSGYEKRVAALLGMPNARRRHLSLPNPDGRIRPFGIVPYSGNQPLSPVLEYALTHFEFYNEGENEEGEPTARLRVWSAPFGLPQSQRHVLLSHPGFRADYILRPGVEEELNDLINFARQYQYYLVVHYTSSNSYRFLLLDDRLHSHHALAWRFPTLSNRMKVYEAIQEIQHLAQGRLMEGMHVIEHHLLRPLTEDGAELAPITFSSAGDFIFIEDPYSFQVSIFLPGWAPRFQDETFRVLVERTLREELPAHLFAWIYWVNPVVEDVVIPAHRQTETIYQSPREFIAFEDAYREWLEALNNYGSIPTEENRTALVTGREAFVTAFNALVALRNEADPQNPGRTIVELTNKYEPFDEWYERVQAPGA